MDKLIAELQRLYLLDDQECFPAGALTPEMLAQHLGGEKTGAINLVSDNGLVRTMIIDFNRMGDAPALQHWDRLCGVANALQDQLSLPAPAVSISGGNGYSLWLSLETPVPLNQAQHFLHLLRKTYFPDIPNEEIGLRPDTLTSTTAELPPCLHMASGRWAAFINPGMGASFADESGLEMMPPYAAQAAFLEGLQSISDKQFTHAITTMHPAHGKERPHKPAAPAAHIAQEGLLLKDATLEDIIQHLHGKNIEPTFRHVIPKDSFS
ncbi:MULTISPECIES: hypothetical protein [unclassified Duganella]|uniref:hypothetical protein n=1 Tax=unclassified Duganella TaxID=2636909 RepID=UPI000E34A1CA|nr:MULTISPECIES: hypothetical protein [unclassified Duganella]RFP08619.1 hypothetical protein D0T23_28290 [Duganella sp. BJB475]RFP27527.1 hypothetical protein D0T21_22465 [Duganella sp. BJB476]